MGQTISTRFLTTDRGSFVEAMASGGHKIRIPRPNTPEPRAAHEAALRALVAKLGWRDTVPRWIGALHLSGMIWLQASEPVTVLGPPYGVAVMQNDLGFDLPEGWVEIQRDDALGVFPDDEAAAKACSPEARLYPDVPPSPHGRQPWNVQVWIVPAASVGEVAS